MLSATSAKLVKHPAAPYAPATDAQEQGRLTVARKIAEHGGANSKDLLPYLTTEHAARDMDRIRTAFHRDKLDHLGYSYGTKLGATYATVFPSRTGRVIVDSVDATVTAYASQHEQDPALQHRTGQFFAWAAGKNGAYHRDAGRSSRRGQRAARRSTICSPPPGAPIWTGATWPRPWRITGVGTRARCSAQPTSSPSAASTWPSAPTTAWTTPGPTTGLRGIGTPRRRLPALPLFAWLNTWYSAPCAFWKASTARPVKIGSAKVPPVLLLQAKDDAATPVEGARRMHQVLSGSRLVVAGGGNHGQYLFDGNTCMDRHGSRCLLTGPLPADDATCRRPGAMSTATLMPRGPCSDFQPFCAVSP